MRRLLGMLALGLLIVGCAHDENASSPAMNSKTAVNGPDVSDWAAKNPNNGKGGHVGEK